MNELAGVSLSLLKYFNSLFGELCGPEDEVFRNFFSISQSVIKMDFLSDV